MRKLPILLLKYLNMVERYLLPISHHPEPHPQPSQVSHHPARSHPAQRQPYAKAPVYPIEMESFNHRTKMVAKVFQSVNDTFEEHLEKDFIS